MDQSVVNFGVFRTSCIEAPNSVRSSPQRVPGLCRQSRTGRVRPLIGSARTFAIASGAGAGPGESLDSHRAHGRLVLTVPWYRVAVSA